MDRRGEEHVRDPSSDGQGRRTVRPLRFAGFVPQQDQLVARSGGGSTPNRRGGERPEDFLIHPTWIAKEEVDGGG